MRRLRDRTPPSTLFRGREFARLLTMVGMLVVLFMLIDRARDPGTWRWLAGDPAPQDDPTTPAPAKEHPKPKAEAVPAQSAAKQPTDRDPQEQEKIEQEFQAVTDNAPLAAEEMFAYKRLMRWMRAQSFAEMSRRANDQLRFADLWHTPDRYRGKLVKLRLHLARAIKQDGFKEVVPGVKQIYELVGRNAQSGANWFWLVCTDLPDGMPQGLHIQEEGTFVGYFLKHLWYEDGTGKRFSTPVLIGRLVWHPSPPQRPAEGDPAVIIPVLLVGSVVVLVAVFGGYFLWKPRRRPAAVSRKSGPTETRQGVPIESWLEQADFGEGEADDWAINGSPQGENNGVGPARPLADRLDWPPDAER